VLAEINNSSRLRRKLSRQRVDEAFPIFQDENPMATPKGLRGGRETSFEAYADWYAYFTRKSERSRGMIVRRSNFILA